MKDWLSGKPDSFAIESLPDADFLDRLHQQKPRLRATLAKLYGQQSDFGHWFDQLLRALAAAHAARPAPLKTLDQQRLADPQWFQRSEMLGYCSYVDRLGRTLQGVAATIDYLQELGVRYLHLLPFLRARAGDNDGGFAVSDFDSIEPALGTMQDLEALTARLREARISLCADFVLNHVADDHAWAQAARAGDIDKQRYFHLFPDRREPDRFEQDLGQIFPRTAPGNFTAVPALKAWAWTTFYPYQWDLNYSNPAVFAEMALALLRLANRGIEVFRLDSAPYLWKRAGSDCRNQPETHWILQALRSIVDIAAPAVLLKAEAIVPTPELAPYFGLDEARGHECHLAYQSSAMAACWAAVAEQRVDLLRSVIEGMPDLPPQAAWITYIRCHDDIGWNVLRPDAERSGDPERLRQVSRFYAGHDNSFSSGVSFQADDDNAVHGSNGMSASLLGLDRARTAHELEQAESRLLLLYSVVLAMSGIPLIYMGDELGQRNDLSEASATLRATDSRWLQRPFFDEQASAQRQDRGTSAGRIFSALQILIRRRQQIASLSSAQPTRALDTAAPSLLALHRGEDFLALANFSEAACEVRLWELLPLQDDEQWIDAISGRIPDHEERLAAWSYRWLLRVKRA